MEIPNLDFEKYRGKTLTNEDLPVQVFNALMRGGHKTNAPWIFPKIKNGNYSLDAHAVAIVGPEQLGELIDRVGPKGVQAIKEALGKIK